MLIKYPAIGLNPTACQNELDFFVNIDRVSWQLSVRSWQYSSAAIYAYRKLNYAICTSSNTLPFSHLIIRDGKVRMI